MHQSSSFDIECDVDSLDEFSLNFKAAVIKKFPDAQLVESYDHEEDQTIWTFECQSLKLKLSFFDTTV